MTQKLKKQENSDEDDEEESEEKTNLEPEHFKDKQWLFVGIELKSKFFWRL